MCWIMWRITASHTEVTHGPKVDLCLALCNMTYKTVTPRPNTSVKLRIYARNSETFWCILWQKMNTNWCETLLAQSHRMTREVNGFEKYTYMYLHLFMLNWLLSQNNFFQLSKGNVSGQTIGPNPGWVSVCPMLLCTGALDCPSSSWYDSPWKCSRTAHWGWTLHTISPSRSCHH